MTESDTTQAAEIIENRSDRIRLTQAGLEWIAAVAFPDQRSTVLIAPDSETAIDRAREKGRSAIRT